MNSTILDIFELISRLADLSLRLRFTANMFRRIGAQSFHCENNFQFKRPEFLFRLICIWSTSDLIVW